MKTKIYAVLALLCVLCLALAGCGSKEAAPAATEAPKAAEEAFAENVEDKDFSALRTPGSQEAAYEYTAFFRPAIDGINQPYVGDTMPYYEDGTYYIYYLIPSIWLPPRILSPIRNTMIPLWNPPAAAVRTAGQAPGLW